MVWLLLDGIRRCWRGGFHSTRARSSICRRPSTACILSRRDNVRVHWPSLRRIGDNLSLCWRGPHLLDESLQRPTWLCRRLGRDAGLYSRYRAVLFSFCRLPDLLLPVNC